MRVLFYQWAFNIFLLYTLIFENHVQCLNSGSFSSTGFRTLALPQVGFVTILVEYLHIRHYIILNQIFYSHLFFNSYFALQELLPSISNDIF